LIKKEFEIDGIPYAVHGMNAFDAGDIAAILGPLLVPFAKLSREDGTFARLASINAQAGGEKNKEMMAVLFDNLEKLMQLVASMPSSQRHEVMQKCLEVVSRRQKGTQTWVPIWNQQASRLQFDELNDLPKALRICGEVIGAHLKSFFPASLLE
jgi:hypothetical protein